MVARVAQDEESMLCFRRVPWVTMYTSADLGSAGFGTGADCCCMALSATEDAS